MELHRSHNIHRGVAGGIGAVRLTFDGCASAVIEDPTVQVIGVTSARPAT